MGAFDSTFIMQQSLILSIFFEITFSVQAVRMNNSARVDQFDRTARCAQEFRWKDPGIKLMEDCDILKNKVKILLNEMTERTECIDFVDLAIDGEQSPRWNKNDHPNTKPHWILMANPVSDRKRKGQRWVIV